MSLLSFVPPLLWQHAARLCPARSLHVRARPQAANGGCPRARRASFTFFGLDQHHFLKYPGCARAHAHTPLKTSAPPAPDAAITTTTPCPFFCVCAAYAPSTNEEEAKAGPFPRHKNYGALPAPVPLQRRAAPKNPSPFYIVRKAFLSLTLLFCLSRVAHALASEPLRRHTLWRHLSCCAVDGKNNTCFTMLSTHTPNPMSLRVCLSLDAFACFSPPPVCGHNHISHTPFYLFCVFLWHFSALTRTYCRFL